MIEESSQQQVEDISLIIKDLTKVVKVVSLYPENNPLPQNLKRSFAEKFESIIDDYGDIKLTVDKERLCYAGDIVYRDTDNDEAFVSLLFDSGILTIDFKSGLDVNEIYRFLEIIKQGINAQKNTYDLVNSLWEADLPNVTLTTAEDIALASYDGDTSVQEFHRLTPGSAGLNDSGELLDPSRLPEGFKSMFEPGSDAESDEFVEVNLTQSDLDGLSKEDLELLQQACSEPLSEPMETDSFPSVINGKSLRESLQQLKAQKQASENQNRRQPISVLSEAGADDDELKISEAVEAMGFAQVGSDTHSAPDPSLILNDQFRLSQEEEEMVTQMLLDDAEFDPFESTAELAMEMMHQEDEMSAFYETISVVEKVTSEIIRHGHLREAKSIVTYMHQLEDQLRPDKQLWAERLRDARVTLGSRDRLKILIEALNAQPTLAPDALKGFLAIFGWESLGAITDMLPELSHEVHREALRTHLSSLGGKNIQIISRGIYDKRPHVVRNAIGVLAGIDSDQATVHLKKAAEHKDRSVRLELAHALKTSPNENSLELLKIMAEDRDTEIRQVAISAVVAKRGQAAFDVITSLINGEHFTTIEHQDRLSLMIAYSKLGGEHALEFLRQVASQWDLLCSGQIKLMRREAFEAIAHNANDKAGRLLVRLASSWRPALKKLAIKALQQRREIMYGGDNDSDL